MRFFSSKRLFLGLKTMFLLLIPPFVSLPGPVSAPRTGAGRRIPDDGSRSGQPLQEGLEMLKMRSIRYLCDNFLAYSQKVRTFAPCFS